MKNDVEDFFDEEQREGSYGEQDLKVFRTKFGGGYGLHSPLRGRALSEPTNAPDRVQIDQGASQSHQHHWNAYPIAV
jgi:hypothetical protein